MFRRITQWTSNHGHFKQGIEGRKTLIREIGIGVSRFEMLILGVFTDNGNQDSFFISAAEGNIETIK
jgi:hypothetical protein